VSTAHARQVPELTRFVSDGYDPDIMRADREARGASRGVRCPNCGSRQPWVGNPHRPFCSLRCRLIDLGRWLDERYRVEAEPISLEDDDAR
jgi:endogenous inhibitor of DNA gyrase (YacG/DUF329 family)